MNHLSPRGYNVQVYTNSIVHIIGFVVVKAVMWSDMTSGFIILLLPTFFVFDINIIVKKIFLS